MTRIFRTTVAIDVDVSSSMSIWIKRSESHCWQRFGFFRVMNSAWRLWDGSWSFLEFRRNGSPG